MNPYTIHDAAGENAGKPPVWNVKGPGIDRLVTGPWAQHTKSRAEQAAEDLNIAYRQGFEAGKKERA